MQAAVGTIEHQYVQAAGDFAGDLAQNQLTFKSGDILKVVPGKTNNINPKYTLILTLSFIFYIYIIKLLLLTLFVLFCYKHTHILVSITLSLSSHSNTHALSLSLSLWIYLGGNEEWSIGFVVFSDNEHLPDSAPLFFPANFVVAVDYTPPPTYMQVNNPNNLNNPIN